MERSTISGFEDLEVWQMARQLTREIYLALKENKDFWFRDQIQRASISIMNNIAEGFERFSQQEKLQFYRYAKSSASEVRSMLYVAEDINYIWEDQITLLQEKVLLIGKFLWRLIQVQQKNLN